MLPPSIYLQTIGRALRGRLVHAARARKLRRRGEIVRPAGYSATGRAQYRWVPGARLVIIHTPSPMGQTGIMRLSEPARRWTLDNHSQFMNPENYHLGE